jgi:SAM-dependent methyltransferase
MVLKVMGKAARVVAVDIAPDVIREAELRFANNGVSFAVDNCEELATVRGPVDLICSFENIEHLNHPDKFVLAAANLLSEDGVLLCSTPDRAETEHEYVNGRPANEFHVNEWYRDEFQKLLEVGFAEVEMLTQLRSFGYVAKQRSAKAVQNHMKYLWSSPMLRLERGVRKLFGKETPWHDVTWLLAPQPSDFPIVPTDMVGVMGEVHCHLAICKKPKKPTSPR